MWREIFASSNFCDFPAIRKNKFPQIKITANIFFRKNIPQREIFSNLNSLHKNTILRNHVCSITTCLFRSETKRNTINFWFISFARKYHQCWVPGTFWESQILIPSKKNQFVLITKISSRKRQKNRQSAKTNSRKNFAKKFFTRYSAFVNVFFSQHHETPFQGPDKFWTEEFFTCETGLHGTVQILLQIEVLFVVGKDLARFGAGVV